VLSDGDEKQPKAEGEAIGMEGDERVIDYYVELLFVSSNDKCSNEPYTTGQ